MTVNNLLKRCNITAARNYNFVSRNRKRERERESRIYIHESRYSAFGANPIDWHDNDRTWWKTRIYLLRESKDHTVFNSRGDVLRPESHRRAHNGRRRHRYLSLNFLNESLREYVNQCAACTRIFLELHARCIRFISDITRDTTTTRTIIKLNRLSDN